MTAAVLYGKEDVKIERVPIPVLEKGEVLIRVQAALTCGTDLKVYRRGYHAKMIVPPALFGHEFAGVIEEVGPGSQEFQGWAARRRAQLGSVRAVLLLQETPGESLRGPAVQQRRLCGVHPGTAAHR